MTNNSVISDNYNGEVKWTNNSNISKRTRYVEKGGEVIAKTCHSCSQMKLLGDFHKAKSKFAGRNSVCKKCTNEKNKEKYAPVQRKIILSEKDGVSGKQCTKCGHWKPLNSFYNGKCLGGKTSECKECKTKRTKKDTEFAKNRVTWTKEIIIDNVKLMHSLEQPLNSDYVFKNDHKLWSAGVRHFGSWLNAVYASEIKLKDIITETKREPWTEEKIIDLILDLHADDETLTTTYVRDKYPKLYDNACKKFSNWRNALTNAGLDEENILQQQKREYWSSHTVIKEIKEFYNRFRDLSYSCIQYNGRRDLVGAACKQFGTWKDAVEMAGYDYLYASWNTNNIAMFGFEFERLVKNLLDDLRIPYEYQKGINNNKLRPDFTLKNNIIIDAKLSEWTIYSCDSIEKYEPNCMLLMVVYLRGDADRDEMISDKTRLISVFKLIKQLPKYRQKYYFQEVVRIERQVNLIGKQEKVS